MAFFLVLYYSECVCVCVYICTHTHTLAYFQSFNHNHNSMKKILLLFHYREVKKINQGHLASKSQDKNSNPGWLASETQLSIRTLYSFSKYSLSSQLGKYKWPVYFPTSQASEAILCLQNKFQISFPVGHTMPSLIWLLPTSPASPSVTFWP